MIDGITYSVAGDGPQTLVFLHGIGADASSFHHQMGAFPGVRTLAWNMPGYQGSDVRMQPPDFAHLSDRLGALIDGLGGPVHLIGQSIGGMIALDHAIRQPQHLRTLTLVTTTPRFGGRDDRFRNAFLAARLGPLDRGQSMAQMAADAAPGLVGPGTDPLEVRRISDALAQVPEATWRGILQCLVGFDRAQDLASVTCPALVVAGSADRNAPAATMEKMAARIADARFHLLEGAGHMLHQEMPAAFNAILAQFLDEVATYD